MFRDIMGSQSRHSSKETRESGWRKERQEDEYVRMDRTETKKISVLETTEQSSETRARWARAEPSVWTDHMLDALENGIRGEKETKWFCLTDKICASANLKSAYAKAARNGGAAGEGHLDAKRFTKQLDERLERIRTQSEAGDYYRLTRTRKGRVSRFPMPNGENVSEKRCDQSLDGPLGTVG